MNDYTEQRAYQRCNYHAPATCAYFNSDRFIHAKTTNHSRGGINFISDFPFKAGASLYFRIDYSKPNEFQPAICNCGGVRQLGLAEVKWCREEPCEYGTCYRIGLKYDEPAI